MPGVHGYPNPHGDNPVTLPKSDQPDNYTGRHTTCRVRWVAMESNGNHYTGHLFPNHTANTPPIATTYCTRHNPTMVCDLSGVTARNRFGGQIIVSNRGVTLPTLQSDLNQLRYHSRPIHWCTNCLTMLAVEAEMTGQRDYPVKRLVQEMKRGKRHKTTP